MNDLGFYILTFMLGLLLGSYIVHVVYAWVFYREGF